MKKRNADNLTLTTRHQAGRPQTGGKSFTTYGFGGTVTKRGSNKEEFSNVPRCG